MGDKSFAERMKAYQADWAKMNKLDHLLEPRTDSQPSWVLKDEHKTKNLWNPSWWTYLGRHEHRWARALNSSQCFGVNLFAPFAEKPSLAKRVLETLLPHRALKQDHQVSIFFEHTPQGAPEWLGEKNQPTQVDVFFAVTRREKPIGYLLVEVKFTESEFGSCRGAVPPKPEEPGNPDSSRCLNLKSVFESPQSMCWMAEAPNGRHYWDLMRSPKAAFKFTPENPCPFRQGLYQLMRNQVLAIALVQHTSADWAEFGVCLHPDNKDVRQLSDAVAGRTDAVDAFKAILPEKTNLIEVHPSVIIGLASEYNPALSEWADWMRARYELHL